MKKVTPSVGILIPVTLIGLTLLALMIINQAHAHQNMIQFAAGF